MRQITRTRKSPGAKIVKDIKRATHKQYSSEEKIRIVLDGLRDEGRYNSVTSRMPCGDEFENTTSPPARFN